MAADGLAASEEELVLLAMFGQEAESLLQAIRHRHSREASLLGGDVDLERAERIRELVKIVQESGVGEIEIEDEGMRVSVRRADDTSSRSSRSRPRAQPTPSRLSRTPGASAAIRVESPMVGVFYRQAEPGTPPFVEVGDVVMAGQTLCLLEAMKLFNELQAESDGRVRVDPRRERPARRVRDAPLRARADHRPSGPLVACSLASSSPTGVRSRCG